jgi:cation diffusion facilitator CzcD-associated flavoprotein CzcO
LITGDVISHLVADGVVTKDGTVHKCDAVVFATGYQTNYYNEDMPIYGVGGRSLKDDWVPFAWAHNSMTVTGYPGLFYWYVVKFASRNRSLKLIS